MNISFVYPTFLFALALIAVPIIVHLFDFRRFKKVFFTNVAFLKELREETSSTSRLKHLLVLLSRILAVVFLVLAFAQPYIPEGPSGKIAAARLISVYLDNSFSMEAVSREGSLLDAARSRAVKLAMGFRPSDRFQLVTNDFDPAHQRLVSREDFISMVQEVKPSSSSRRLSEVTLRQLDLLNTGDADEKLAFVISDFQTRMADLPAMKADSTVKTYLIPLESGEVSNAFIDSVWLDAPVVRAGEPCRFKARIRNAGELDLEAIPVNLVINGTRKAVATASVAAGTYTDIDLAFTPETSGWQQGMVEITDNPVIFDDRYFFSLSVAEQIHVLCINGGKPSSYLQALFGADAFFRFTEQDIFKLDYASVQSNDMVVLSEIRSVPTGLSAALKLFCEKGGTVVFVPDSASDPVATSALLNGLGGPTLSGPVISDELTVSLALEDPLFTGVFSTPPRQGEQADLPRVRKYFLSQGGAEVLMKLRSGNPLLSRHVSGKGSLYVFTVPFSGEFSNLSRHAVFVPVMYRMALLSRHQGPLAYSIGKDSYVTLSDGNILSGDPVFHLVQKGSDFDVIPSVRSTGSGISLGFGGQVTQSGNYTLELEGKPVRDISFNYNRDESVLAFYDQDKLDEMSAASRFGTVKTFDADKTDIAAGVVFTSGVALWKYCIILALVFLFAEILLLKFWKR